MKQLFRGFKWLVIAIISLTIALFIYMNYVISVFDTETLPQYHGQVQTKLFLRSKSKQPLVVAFGGAEGGNSWAGIHGTKQRDLLQKNGYAFLSIAYFGVDNTPTNLDRISINGIHEAIMEISQHPKINGGCIAVMGVSRGGELALLLGSYYSEYKSVIGIVPGSAVFPALTDAMTTPGFSYQNQSLPFVPVPWSATPALLSGDLRGAFEEMMKNTEAMREATIKIENIAGPIMLISSTTDEQWPSLEMSDMMMNRLKGNDFKYPKMHVKLEGGHNEHHDEFEQVIQFLDEHLRNQPDCI